MRYGTKLCFAGALFMGVFSPGITAAGEPELATKKQKFSYVMGVQFGQQIRQHLLKENMDVEIPAFLAAMEDVLAGTMPEVSLDDLRAGAKEYLEEIVQERRALAEKNQAREQAFLSANKAKEGVVELPSGVQYRVIEEGEGSKPTTEDTVVVHYRGTLLDGQEFDNSHQRGEPAKLPMANVIQGWKEVLPLMSQGAKWQVFIPARLAYGERGAGSSIGPNETLTFDIDLIEVQ